MLTILLHAGPLSNSPVLNAHQLPVINPYLTNGFSHRYHLGESTVNLRGVRGEFDYLFHFSMKFLQANKIAPDGTLHSAASHLGLFCLPMSHKRDARLK